MMANVALKSIKFPGLADTYTVPQIDSTLAVTGKAADAKAVGDALVTKADTDGDYPTLTVGVAKQLESTVGITDNAPYLFRTAGGSADIGDLETDKLVGGTVCMNQVFPITTSSFSRINVELTNNASHGLDVKSTNNSDVNKGFRFGLGVDAVFYVAFDAIVPAPTSDMGDKNYVYCGIKDGSSSYYQTSVYTKRLRLETSGGKVRAEYLSASDSGHRNCAIVIHSKAPANMIYVFENVVVINVTKLLGSSIADRINSIESATLGAGIAILKKIVQTIYYPKTNGNLLSVKAISHDMVGFNAYDNSAGEAKVVGGNVYQITGAYTALSLDGEMVTPDSDGYFTPPNNGILTVTGGNATTTCVHLKWDGEKDGEWEPYVKHSYSLDSDLELRGIPMLSANNELYYDGDTYESDGTVTRKFGIRAYESGDATDGVDMVTDGTNTVYRLTTPTTEQAAPFQNPQQVDDFGTEEYVDSRTVPLPVGHTTFYQANLRAKLEMSPNSPDGDGDYIVRQTDGENEYVPLVIPPAVQVVRQTLSFDPGVSVAADAAFDTYDYGLAIEVPTGYEAKMLSVVECNTDHFAILRQDFTGTPPVFAVTVRNVDDSAHTLSTMTVDTLCVRATQ